MSVKPETLNFDCVAQNGDFSKVFCFPDTFDFTGKTAEMQVRNGFDGDVVLDLNTTNGKITIDAIENKLQIDVSRAEMLTVAPKKYDYDLVILEGLGGSPYFKGKFNVVYGYSK